MAQQRGNILILLLALLVTTLATAVTTNEDCCNYNGVRCHGVEMICELPSKSDDGRCMQPCTPPGNVTHFYN